MTMPEILLNRAAFTRTTGTANPTLTGDTGKSGSMSTVPTGTQVAYVRRYSSNKPGFENCIGIWRAVAAAGSIGYIERTSVELSSNPGDDGYDPVVWGVGEQTVDVTITPDMIVADDDPRLDTVAVGDLGTVATIDGTEAWMAEQGGEGFDLTVDQVLGDPVRQQRSHGLNYLRDFTDFHRTRPTFSATDGALIDLEPWVARINGSGAAVLTGKFLGVNGLILSTGTTTTGYAVIEHTMAPFLFAPANNMTAVFRGGLNGILPSVEAFTVQIGFRDGGAALATVGLYFQASAASLNWRAVTNTGSDISNVDTGVPITINVTKRFKIVRDAVLDVTRFYIDETLVHTSTPGRVNALSALKMMATIHKSAGTTAAGIGIYEHSYAVQTAAVVGF